MVGISGYGYNNNIKFNAPRSAAGTSGASGASGTSGVLPYDAGTDTFDGGELKPIIVQSDDYNYLPDPQNPNVPWTWNTQNLYYHGERQLPI